jgi:hypothetical protein
MTVLYVPYSLVVDSRLLGSTVVEEGEREGERARERERER